MKLPEATLTQFYRDPVMAAKVLLGWELDDYQAAALRMDWFFPETIDDSAVGTGKTLRIFILVCLRAILIPDQQIGVYFPVFQVAKDEFWPYFAKTIGQSDFFAQQLKPGHGKLGESKQPGAWTMDFKNGSRIIVPAPGHANDGANQAGRSFNTLVVDDWRKCEEKGDALALQLLDRVRRPCWNQDHPIWGNHTHLKGHAEGSGHKSHGRATRFRHQIRDGSMRHAGYSFCYRDVSKPWRKRIRNDRLIRNQKRNLPTDRFHCQYLGISARSGSSYYPESTLERCCNISVVGELRRPEGAAAEEVAYAMGFDVAPGQTVKSDYSSAFIYRIRKASIAIPATLRTQEFGDWELTPVFAHTLRNRSAGETSAFIHWLDDRFTLSAVVLDQGGGGQWVYKELVKPQQSWPELGWFDRPVIGLCDNREAIIADKRPIVHFFKRGEVFDHLSFVHRNCLIGDEGFLFAAHQRYQQAFYGREIVWPLPLADRTPEQFRPWEPDLVECHRTLDRGFGQLSAVRQVTNPDGTPATSKRGFPLFAATGKKDIAYSSLYAFMGAMQWIERHGEQKATGAEAYFSCSTR